MIDPEVFAARFLALSDEHKSVGRGLCAYLEVPYLEDRCEERLLGHRLKDVTREDAIRQGLLSTRRFRFPDGRIVDQDEFPEVAEDAEQLTEEVWSKDHWPDCFHSIPEAVQKLPHGVTAGYFHKHSLNLVLLSPMGEKIGIRRTEFMIPKRSMLTERVAPLARLRKAATA